MSLQWPFLQVSELSTCHSTIFLSFSCNKLINMIIPALINHDSNLSELFSSSSSPSSSSTSPNRKSPQMDTSQLENRLTQSIEMVAEKKRKIILLKMEIEKSSSSGSDDDSTTKSSSISSFFSNIASKVSKLGGSKSVQETHLRQQEDQLFALEELCRQLFLEINQILILKVFQSFLRLLID